MTATAMPTVFPAATGFTVVIVGGRPPYTVTPMPSPPNPPGVTVDMGPPIRVTVPADTPSGTIVRVVITDSSTPSQSCPCTAQVY